MSRSKAVAFEHRSARRIATQVRQRERTPVNQHDLGRAAPKFLSDIRVAFIKTTSAVTARSGSTPGTGTAVTWTFDGTHMVDGTSTITVRNISAKTGGMATGKYGFAILFFNAWWVFALEC